MTVQGQRKKRFIFSQRKSHSLVPSQDQSILTVVVYVTVDSYWLKSTQHNVQSETDMSYLLSRLGFVVSPATGPSSQTRAADRDALCLLAGTHRFVQVHLVDVAAARSGEEPRFRLVQRHGRQFRVKAKRAQQLTRREFPQLQQAQTRFADSQPGMLRSTLCVCMVLRATLHVTHPARPVARGGSDSAARAAAAHVHIRHRKRVTRPDEARLHVTSSDADVTSTQHTEHSSEMKMIKEEACCALHGTHHASHRSASQRARRRKISAFEASSVKRAASKERSRNSLGTCLFGLNHEWRREREVQTYA